MAAIFVWVFLLATTSVAIYRLIPHLLSKIIVVATIFSIVALTSLGYIAGIEAYPIFGYAFPRILLLPALATLVLVVVLQLLYMFNAKKVVNG